MRALRVVLLFFAGVVISANAPEEPWILANRLALQYEEWANLRKARVNNPLLSNTTDAKERQAWDQVKSMWKTFSRAQDAEYAGTR